MSAPPIVFDLDGTLIDSAPDIHAAVARMLKAEGLEPLPLAEARGFIGNGVAVLVERVMAAVGLAPAEHPRLLARFQAEYDAAPSALTRVFDGAEAALTALGAAGHPLGVCSNKPEATSRAILADLGLLRHFCAIVGGDSLPVRKPHPGPLLEAFRLLGAETGLYVGDSEVDAETAEAAVTPLFLFTKGYRKAAIEAIPHHRAFDSHARLPALIAETTGVRT
ncbi:MAG: phosphoglycolate phosphatase [Proteobacteria bacterium]|nr:phosphoglycolate phosphatase [Pseudomonadota bacterium]